MWKILKSWQNQKICVEGNAEEMQFKKIYNRIPAFRLKNVRYKVRSDKLCSYKIHISSVTNRAKNVRCKVKGVFNMPKKYNTPKRSIVVKTRMTEEKFADFTERVEFCGISQSEFIRQAIENVVIKPIITVSPINEKLLSVVGSLTAQLGKIGGDLNQIARFLNEHGTPNNSLSGEVRAAISDLADLKFEILRKVGDAVGDVQTFKL